MNDCSCSNGTCEDCVRDMRTAFIAVRQLHTPIRRSRNGLEVCKGCTELARIGQRHNLNQPGIAYPCATIRLLDKAGV